MRVYPTVSRQERPPGGDRDVCRPRPRHGSASACCGADGLTGGRRRFAAGQRGCIGCNQCGWLPGHVPDVTNDAEAQRVPRSCGAGRDTAHRIADDALDAIVRSVMHRDVSRRNDDAR